MPHYPKLDEEMARAIVKAFEDSPRNAFVMEYDHTYTDAPDEPVEGASGYFASIDINRADMLAIARAALEAVYPMMMEEAAVHLEALAEAAAETIRNNAHRAQGPFRNERVARWLDDMVQRDRKFRDAAAAIRAMSGKPNP